MYTVYCVVYIVKCNCVQLQDLNLKSKFFSHGYTFFRVDRVLGFPIGTSLRAIAQNCAQLFSNCVQLCGIARNCEEVTGIAIARK